jgi:heme-degrading monooxygenase HmoA
MYAARFAFRPGEYDDEFHRLDELDQRAAESNPGYEGKESWVSAEGDERLVVYYWSDLESLREFSQHPDHLEAKRRYEEWYEGYEVVISEVLRRYGDGRLDG